MRYALPLHVYMCSKKRYSLFIVLMRSSIYITIITYNLAYNFSLIFIFFSMSIILKRLHWSTGQSPKMRKNKRKYAYRGVVA